jgi:hypothetical protein
MRKLASIQVINKIEPIIGADRIVLATVLGWQCIVKKDEFKEGDKVIYIECDSVCPDIPHFEFLRQKKFRIKIMKMRGVYSMGLVMPLSILPHGEFPILYREGDDVTEDLHITKYDSENQLDHLVDHKNKQPRTKLGKFLYKFAWYRKLFVQKKRHGWPAWIKKTDETRIQAMPEVFRYVQENKIPLIISEKTDGTSSTFYLEKIPYLWFWHKYNFGYCSRNVNLTTHSFKNKYFKGSFGDFYHQIVEKYQIKKVLRELIGKSDRLVLQGEILGPGIQKNKYKLSDYELRVFNLIYPEISLDTVEIKAIMDKYEIPTVPILETNYVVPLTIPELVEYSKGNSILLPTQKQEGIVCRNVEKGISFKVVNPDFLLENEE